MAKYEAVFILDPRKVEGNGEAFSASVEEQLKSLGGEVTRVKCLDKRVFARPIGKHKAGVYWDYVFVMPETAVAALQEKYSLNSTVLRLAVFLFVDGQDDDVFKPRAERERILNDESFQDEFDRDDRPYRSFRDGGR